MKHTQKRFKRSVSIVLAIALLLSSVQFLVYAEDDLSDIPIVEVLGAFHPLYSNAGTAQQSRAFDFTSFDQVFASLFSESLLELYKERLSTLTPYALTDLWAETLTEQFKIMGFNPDGTPMYELDGNLLANEWYVGERNGTLPPGGEWRRVTMDRMYVFDFDWRKSPIVIAEQLNAYIQRVKEHSGHDKVNLSLQSGSAGVGLAYLAEYGTGDLHAYWSEMSLFSSTLFGEAMNKRIHFDSEALFNSNLLTGMNNETVQKILEVLSYFEKAGLLRVIFGGAYIALRPTMVNRLFEKMVTPCVASAPVMWSYVPPEDYESGIKTVFGSRNGEYAGLINVLDEYHNKVSVNAEAILAKAATEIRVGLFASYGTALVPLVKGTNVNSDSLVDLKYSTMGATSSAPGETLSACFGKPYAQAKNDGHNHLSPDGQVDASTCLLPETTWFSNDGQHFTVHQISRLRHWFYDTEGATVHTDPQNNPQFLQVNPEFDWGRSSGNCRRKEYYEDPNIAVAYIPQEVPVAGEEEAREAWEYLVDILLALCSVVVYFFTWWMDLL